MACTKDQENTTGGSGTGWGYGSTTKIAQSFTAGDSGTLCKVVLNLKKSNTPTDTIDIYVCSDNSGVPGTQISDTAQLDLSTLTTDFVAKTFTLAQAYLVSGIKYWIVLYRSTDDGTNTPVSEYANNSNPYADGAHFTYNGTWNEQSNDDLVFEVWSDPAIGSTSTTSSTSSTSSSSTSSSTSSTSTSSTSSSTSSTSTSSTSSSTTSSSTSSTSTSSTSSSTSSTSTSSTSSSTSSTSSTSISTSLTLAEIPRVLNVKNQEQLPSVKVKNNLPELKIHL